MKTYLTTKAFELIGHRAKKEKRCHLSPAMTTIVIPVILTLNHRLSINSWTNLDMADSTEETTVLKNENPLRTKQVWCSWMTTKRTYHQPVLNDNATRNPKGNLTKYSGGILVLKFSRNLVEIQLNTDL